MPGGLTSICLYRHLNLVYVRATRNLVDMALTSAHRKSLHFLLTSSIGPAHSWDRPQGLYPEEVR